MKQVINSTSEHGWPNIEVEYHRPIELFVDNFVGFDQYKNSFKILWVRESEEIGKLKMAAIKNHKIFNAIITCEEHILSECNNSYFMPFGTAWVRDYDFNIIKKFQISHLTGFKEQTKGHRLRKKIYYEQDKIIIPKDFYISQHGGVENLFDNKILGELKNPLFESMFHVCIENTMQKNYFTEKLIDCFITKTIPIYWGCENIGNFFDVGGMYIVNNMDDIICICNSLDDNAYKNKIDYVNNNFKTSQQYITILDRLEYTIKKILKEVK
jgi:hypothetical protein